ncbi:MAG: cell division topological specificity factor MinE, partial [Synergistales bacterium]|nr:cell division topological specificity factor MinE [Synergistales bacterium]
FSKGTSREKAKKRLQLVLIHDRADISPMMLENLRSDLIDVINKYMEIDIQNIEMDLDRDNGSVALVANIPVLSIKRGNKADKA